MNDSGFILINKPVDWTSHDVVGYLRRVTGIKKIGHAGTLDPFATGLLIVGVGREATKRLDEFKGMQKKYIATMQFGAISDTQDSTGSIQPILAAQHISLTTAHISDVLDTFVGKQKQVPPMYSAKKINGKKLYKFARNGETVERAAVDIEIYNMTLLNVVDTPLHPNRIMVRIFKYLLPTAHIDISTCTVRVSCSTGTYIRTICHDIGQKLGTGAYCTALQRTKIGPYRLKQAISPKKIERNNWKTYLIQLK